MTTIRGASITYDLDGKVYFAIAELNDREYSYYVEADHDEPFLEDDVLHQMVSPLRDLVGDYE